MKTFTRILSILLCTALLLCPVSAAEQCTEYTGSNVNANEYYWNWASPTLSYLTETDDGFMRFQSGLIDGYYLVEYYDSDYVFLNNLLIEQELDAFGGFYASENAYYVLSGQNNPNESASVECFRITKYDLDWNRISSVGLYDCNTTIPFRAGSARFAECGKYLLIHTSHEMYAVDGINHQANVTIQVDTDSMKITDSFTKVWNSKGGYVSHSFNQFIKIENNKVITVDHGDSHPRSIVLIKYPTDVTKGSFSTNNGCTVTDLLTIPGANGENYTGVTVGGFEISDTSYLVAYTSVAQDENFYNNSAKNLFVAVMNKDSGLVTQKQFTFLAETDVPDTATTPHLTALPDGSFLLLWSVTDYYGNTKSVNYAKIDGEGNLIGDIMNFDGGEISDCPPVVSNNKLVWYVFEDNTTIFYEIDLTDVSKTVKTELNSEHRFEISSYPTESDATCVIKCSVCSQIQEFEAPTNMAIYWNTDNGSTYWNGFDPVFNVGDTLYYWDTTSNEYTDKLITVSDESAVTHIRESADMGSFTFNKGGTYTITITYKYNPAITKSYEISVEGDFTAGDVNDDGSVDQYDYLLVKRAYFNTYSLSDEEYSRADVNQDGTVDQIDYVLIKRIYFGTYTA